ncbi:MAG: hypothetical protein LBG72_07860 [Spirochaetaceae bacterium]|nr:hypothetical protein [Spirochaetaceae bacterium]
MNSEQWTVPVLFVNRFLPSGKSVLADICCLTLIAPLEFVFLFEWALPTTHCSLPTVLRAALSPETRSQSGIEKSMLCMYL